MNIASQIAAQSPAQSFESAPTTEPIQYAFVVDADLASVGGGSALVDY